MDYGYTTSYTAQGGGGDGGFMPGSQTDSPATKGRQYGKDTLRPVTIKQLNDAHHPNPDAEFFEIDGTEASQVTFVGQIRNISKQVTNVTYRLDDGTATAEVKVWIDSEAPADDSDKGLVENAYVRAWGKLKEFNNKRHVVAHAVRPVQDMNEVNYHLLEATYIHLYFQRGPLGANGPANPQQQQQQQSNAYGAAAATSGANLPASTSGGARKLYDCILNTPQTNEGLHLHDISRQTNMEPNAVLKAADELISLGKIFTTVDDHTWGLLDM